MDLRELLKRGNGIFGSAEQTGSIGVVTINLARLGYLFASAEACKTLVRRALTNFKIPYITITPTFSICSTHGYLSGEHTVCPTCAARGVETECEVWTRVMGYFRPVRSFNIGKKSEHAERLPFAEPAFS